MIGKGSSRNGSRSWEAEVRQRQLRAQIPRQRSTWRQRTGNWLMCVGGWLVHCGEEMAECERSAGVSVAG